jgi:hypothetical protein
LKKEVNMSNGINQLPEKPDDSKSSSDTNLTQDRTTAKELLKFASTWQGDDLEECLEEVYKTRGETTF